MKGKIKFYHQAKGYGFIEAEDGKEVFFHVDDFPEVKLNLKEEVEFEVETDKKGNRAVKIKRIK